MNGCFFIFFHEMFRKNSESSFIVKTMHIDLVRQHENAKIPIYVSSQNIGQLS
ncbi:hypothetical protein PAE9249_01956 [Paenibacillus sp. CECT 9249]|nr:hypothetical protein PAE9249_01956 [Paenibacillus sp. CECT 9249]